MIGHGVPGLDIRQEHEYPVAAAGVFAALTLGLDAWWPVEERVIGPEGHLSLTAQLGAPLVEEAPGGQAAIWAVVDLVEPDRRLYLSGWFGVNGVVAGRVHFDLTDLETGSRLKLSHQAIGPVSEDVHSRRRAQWRRILDTSLREHLSGLSV
eukprot:m.269351 g.269351  ORF g.269351 m.269351 type:complete len:152 (-) comp77780_c0_seq1:204-659(-)